jgi:3-deoxy-manno-octulosonate cytidylyltransferase (CMP-KDO synthetase)
VKIIGIIPARFASTRFPGKPLAVIAGKTMIQRVVEQAKKCNALNDVIVATDDERIFSAVNDFGGNVIMTSDQHQSGTDRCLEALEKSGLSAAAVINIQGDEPMVDPAQIESLAQLISKDEVEIATLAKKIEDDVTLHDPNKVKVVIGENGRAIYFSRYAIPFQKSVERKDWLSHHTYYKHIGLYAYKVNTLKEICSLQPSALEKAESLEQLRWLENGKSIHVAITDIETPSIDTTADLENLLRSLKEI